MTDIIRILDNADEDSELFIEDIDIIADKVPGLKDEDPLMISVLYNQYVDEWHGAGWGLIDTADLARFSEFVKNYDFADYDLTQYLVFNYLGYMTGMAEDLILISNREEKKK